MLYKMEIEFVTLQEGSRLTGKTEMTIRRLKKKPEAAPFIRKEADSRLYIALTFLYKNYQPLPGLIPETKVFQGPPEPRKEEKAKFSPPVQPIQANYTDLILHLQEQNQELKKDKTYLQGKLDEAAEQLRREQERSNFLLLQASNSRPTSEQQTINDSTTTSQRPATKKALLYSLLLAVFLLFAALAYQVARPSTTDQQQINDPSTPQQQAINGDSLP
jgi:hypothetical protein